MSEKGKQLFLFVFVMITALTAVIVLLANIGFFPNVSSDFAKWGNRSILVEIVAVTIAAFKWEFFSTKNMLIVFDFKSPRIPEAKLIECSYQITDVKGEHVDGGKKIKITRGSKPGTWMCFIPLPSNIKYENLTTMTLKDDKGNEYPVTDYILQHTLEV